MQKDIIEKLEKEKIENGSEKKPEAYMFKDNTFYLTKRSLMTDTQLTAARSKEHRSCSPAS